jgi:Arc/MetJ-type ribon-helix-helix transcriptional regulator
MKYRHTGGVRVMARAKVAVSLERNTLDRLDRLVEEAVFRNRSQAVQAAVEEKLERLTRSRLARECAKLDPAFEKALAEEGVSEGLASWPEY